MSGREHRYSTYIMASRSLTLYVGVTNNIEARVREHREGIGGDFTRKYKCDRLVYVETWQDVHQAIGREKEIKGWSCKKEIALIELQNATWIDLSEDWGKPIKLYEWPEAK